MPPYRVTLPAFEGPLDLLLYLVKRQEVDIREVPLAPLAEQFLEFLQLMQELDVELAGDFLVVAATLLEIKAKSLLPELPEEPEAEAGPDPRRELVKQLLEYRQFKDAAQALEVRAERAQERFPRLARPEPAARAERQVRRVEVWDLVSAFARLARETQLAPLTTVQVDDTPQHVYESRVRAALAGGPRTLRELFTPPYTRPRLIGLFLAVLELVKAQRVRLEQADAAGEVALALVEVGQVEGPEVVREE